jgi:hypothetical protein
MPHYDVKIKLNSHTNSFDDVNIELTSLKLIIGLMAAKLTPDCRENLIIELNNFGKPELAKMINQFIPQ